jgi:hypothetical protein
MALSRAEYGTQILNFVRLFVQSNRDGVEEFFQAAFQYSKRGAAEREAIYALLSVAWPSETAHARKHLLVRAGAVDPVDITTTEEPPV